MPRLDADGVAQVLKAGEGGGFQLLPDGKYRMKLVEVESKDSSTGNPMWVWHFKILARIDGPCNDKDGNPIDLSDRKMRYHTVIMESTLFMLNEMFLAFDANPDVDTDLLIGDEVIGLIDQATITKGRSKGKLGNNIINVLALKDGMPQAEDYEKVPAGVGAGKDAKDGEIPF